MKLIQDLVSGSPCCLLSLFAWHKDAMCFAKVSLFLICIILTNDALCDDDILSDAKASMAGKQVVMALKHSRHCRELSQSVNLHFN